MSMSGVVLGDGCKELFTQMQLKHNLRYLTFEIKDKKTIVPVAQADKSKTYADFLGILPAGKPLYCLVDVPFTAKTGAETSKMVFVFWCPDDCGVKEKMLYASSKDVLRKTFTGIQCEVQANDKGDLVEADIIKKLM
ncbi:unnamed protein product [Amoebophrya sp. A120]|nr:unnamed protein product [Amoebophrya sp. A120]|eukprot:GSA120T00005026001.1